MRYAQPTILTTLNAASAIQSKHQAKPSDITPDGANQGVYTSDPGYEADE